MHELCQSMLRRTKCKTAQRASDISNILQSFPSFVFFIIYLCQMLLMVSNEPLFIKMYVRKYLALCEKCKIMIVHWPNLNRIPTAHLHVIKNSHSNSNSNQWLLNKMDFRILWIVEIGSEQFNTIHRRLIKYFTVITTLPRIVQWTRLKCDPFHKFYCNFHKYSH